MPRKTHFYLDDLNDLLALRALSLTLVEFSNSLTAEEYREVTRCGSSTPEFWRKTNGQ